MTMFCRKKRTGQSGKSGKTGSKGRWRSLSTLVASLDRVFSMYIRLRDTSPQGYFRCISCGRLLPFEQADCGHYVNRQHMSLRFSEQNCNAQCRRCNRFDEGAIMDYRRGLVKKIGAQQVELLEVQKHETRKYSNWELEILIDHYKKEVERLKNEKGYNTWK